MNQDGHTPYPFNPILRAAGVFAQGNDLLVTSAEGEDAVILDISDPINPQPIPGGSFVTYDSQGETVGAYHANRAEENWLFFARKEGGGGVMVYDISEPSSPTFIGDVKTEGGNGGYVFYDEGYLFLGDSHWGKVFDGEDLAHYHRDWNRILARRLGYHDSFWKYCDFKECE